MSEKLIKSKKRVKEHAEVFTPGFIVERMNDLCEPLISDISKRVFEPACGNGAFLTRILKRRLKNCKTNFDRLVALSNLYGVDIQKDNVIECQRTLLEIVCEGVAEPEFIAIAMRILATNIVVGDTINAPEKIFFTRYEPAEGGFATSEHCLANMLENP